MDEANIKNSCGNKYHVIVHELVLQNFLKGIDRDIVVYGEREHRNHVHFLFRSKYPIESNRFIQSRKIENKRHYISVYRIFTISIEKLEYFCSATFEKPSLQEMVLNKILSNLCNLHDMKQLNLPAPLMKKLFQQAKSHFQLPEWDGETVSDNMNIFPVTYDSRFVVRYQHTEDIFTSPRYLVENFFVIEGSKESVKMCQKCMKFEIENGLYYRIYRHVPNSDLSNVTDAWNWCHACKCVPLFQTFSSLREMRKQFGVKSFPIPLPDWMILKKECFKDDAVQKESFKDGAVQKECFKDGAVQKECFKYSAVQKECFKDSAVQKECFKDGAVQKECFYHILS